jgi:hypothetical protein
MKKIKISEDILSGGLADNLTIPQIAQKHNVPIKNILKQIVLGLTVEKEHTNSPELAFEIVLDHLTERPDYYNVLKKIENN